MTTLRTTSGRQLRGPGLVETVQPFTFNAAATPGARVLGVDGQIYESMKDQVTGVYEWKVRAQGERGPELELQKSATHVQWRVLGNTGAWNNLIPLADLLGPQGLQGIQGPQGAGLSYQGTVPTVGDLPTPSTAGYAYLVVATGDLWIYSGSAWNNAGPIQGPAGPGVPVGGATKQVLRKQSSTNYQTEWADLVAGDVGLGTSSTPQFNGLGLGDANPPAAGTWALNLGRGVQQIRRTLTAAGGIITIDVRNGNEFSIGTGITGAVTINLSNLGEIEANYIWRGVLSFQYTSGTISWFTGNNGVTVKWDGGAALVPVAGELETVIISHVGGSTTIEVTSMKGRA